MSDLCAPNKLEKKFPCDTYFSTNSNYRILQILINDASTGPDHIFYADISTWLSFTGEACAFKFPVLAAADYNIT